MFVRSELELVQDVCTPTDGAVDRPRTGGECSPPSPGRLLVKMSTHDVTGYLRRRQLFVNKSRAAVFRNVFCGEGGLGSHLAKQMQRYLPCAKTKRHGGECEPFAAGLQANAGNREQTTGGLMDKKLKNKVAVVTGGSAGIGLGAAKRFAAEGAQVFITGRRQSELDKAVAVIGGDTHIVRADSSKLADIDRIYEIVKAKAGRIDILFVNAGFYELGKFGEITEEHFDNTFNTNVRGLFFAVQKALPLLSTGSSVILVGSIASIKGFEAFSIYDATKAAVRSFARSWIVDLRGRGVRVNVLSPGHIDTPGLSVLMTPEQKAGVLANVPLGRLGTPDDMGGVAAFLASDDSAYVNGVELFADGGVAQY